jgi:probable HAF family extracellular repeat protein
LSSLGEVISDAGFVVGTSDIGQTKRIHAFLGNGAMHDLVTGPPPGVTIELERAEWGQHRRQRADRGDRVLSHRRSAHRGDARLPLAPVPTSAAAALHEEVSSLDDLPADPPYPVPGSP